jgi:hypothetical protein
MIYRLEKRERPEDVYYSWPGEWEVIGHVEITDFSEGILREQCKGACTKTKEVRYVRVPTISDWDEIKRIMR